MGQVEYRIADQDHQLLMVAKELARKRLVMGLGDYAVSDPLPELFLGSPELLSVAADNQRCLFFLLFLFLLWHLFRLPLAFSSTQLCSMRALRFKQRSKDTQRPRRGNLEREAAFGFSMRLARKCPDALTKVHS